VTTGIDNEVASEGDSPDVDLAAHQTDGATAYQAVEKQNAKDLRWVPARLFTPALIEALTADTAVLDGILQRIGEWTHADDSKAALLRTLVAVSHPEAKVLIFTQFADTAEYLGGFLRDAEVDRVEILTGRSKDVASVVQRFSPTSNVTDPDAVAVESDIRLLVATDVISEGQNLQDAAIVVNYDLPWAIIRLVQRAGRVDRIGQTAEDILVYSFVPADGIESILNLRERVRRRLTHSNQVIGGDESFFDTEGDDDADRTALIDLYNEKATVLDDPEDISEDVDLGSYALQIWREAVERDPEAERRIPALADVVGATRNVSYDAGIAEGVLAYVRTAAGTDSLVRVDTAGQPLSYSPLAVLQAAACPPERPGLPLDYRHHALVAQAEAASAKQASILSAAGALSGTRRRVYQRMSHYLTAARSTIFTDDVLVDAIEAVHNRPLTENADRILRQRIREGIEDHDIAELLVALHRDDILCRTAPALAGHGETHIVCSVGLFRDPQAEEPQTP